MVATVHGEWHNAAGARSGSYAVYLPVRLTDPAGNLIYPAGMFATGALVDGEFTVTVPGSDDPDISPQDWQLDVRVSFGGETERYAIPVADGTTVELADVVLPQDLGEPEPVLIRGIAGGIAELDDDGTVPLDQLPVLPAFASAFGVINVKVAPYSATGDGVTNDRAAIVAALTDATAAGLTVHFPGGNYLITSAITVPDGVTVRGDRGARIFGNYADAILNVGSRSVVDGLTLQNDTTSSRCVNVLAGASEVRLYRCTFRGNPAHGVYVAQAGISDILVYDCTFDQTGYGFLSNAGTGTGAWDLRDVIIQNCRFDCRSDAIEFNHPTSAAAVAGGFTVADNYIRCPDRVSGGASSGFGIGVANSRDVVINGNRLEDIRQNAIHVEDDCVNVIIANNTVKNVDGSIAGHAASLNVGVTVAKSTNVTVIGNHVEDCRGAGFELVYDGTTVNDQLTITENSATACSHGFDLNGVTPGGHVIVSNNRSYDNTGDGFRTGGNLRSVVLQGNHSYNNGGWGIYRSGGDTGYIRVFRGNILYGNTAGDITGSAVTAGAPTLLYDKITYLTGTTSAGYHEPACFRLGAWAQGKVHISAVCGSARKEITQDVKWDGTTLKVATVRSATHGTIDAKVDYMLDGQMVVQFYTGVGTALAYRANVRFDGWLYENGQVYTGTVASTVLTAIDPLSFASDTVTLTNKRVTPRTGTTTSSATPTINTDDVDFYSITALAVDITSMTSGLSGTPTAGQKLWITIKGTAARAITWGASFEASTVALPTTTVSTDTLDVEFRWNSATSKWRCVTSC